MTTGNPIFPSPKPEGQNIEGGQRYVDFGGFNVDAQVSVDSDGKITFLEDINIKNAPSFMSEGDAQALFDAGILKEGVQEGSRNRYELASEGHSGVVKINKDDLNEAIKNGKLKAEITEEGDIEIL